MYQGAVLPAAPPTFPTMVTINGECFYEKPGSCGSCPFWKSDGSQLSPSCEGWCYLFSERHKSYINLPRRCAKLFNKAFRFPDGARLVITASEA